MKTRIIIISIYLLIPSLLFCQTDSVINSTDMTGKKQGHWIKKYPDNTKMYEGYFRDNYPEGEFRRYNPGGTLKSVLIYSNNAREAIAKIYHPNGFIAARGSYKDKKKEGSWQFFSEFSDGYLVSEEYYSENMRHGKSVKLYPDGKVAELMNFVKDTAQGEWIKYYPDGSLCLKSNFTNGKINGKFEAWFDNSKLQFCGEYINDRRNGQWFIYEKDGKLKYKIEYRMGITNDKQMDLDSSDYLDALESKKGSMPDPEKTGEIW